MQQVPLKGRISSPLAAQGQRVLAATARGISMSMISTAISRRRRCVQVAEHTLTGPEKENRFAVLDGDCCWIADVQLAEYEIHPAKGRLTPKLITGQDSIFPQPPLVAGKTVFYVRRGENLPGMLVSALDTATQKPLADQPGDAAGRRAAAGRRREAHRDHRRGGDVQIVPPPPRSDAIADQPVAHHSAGQVVAADQQRDRHERRHVCHDLRHGVEPDRALRSAAAAAIPLALGALVQTMKNIMTCLPIPMAGGLLRRARAAESSCSTRNPPETWPSRSSRS